MASKLAPAMAPPDNEDSMMPPGDPGTADLEERAAPAVARTAEAEGNQQADMAEPYGPPVPEAEQHHVKMHALHESAAAHRQAAAANADAMGRLDVNDPDYYKKVLSLNEQRNALHNAHGEINEAIAQEKATNPWGTMGNHPGIGGKIGHTFGVLGNVAGDAVLGKGTMSEIPGSGANIEAQSKGGAAEQAEASKEAEQGAHTEAEQATASEAPSIIAKNEADATAKGEPKTNTPDEQVMAAGTRIASGQGTPADLAVVKAFHDLNQAKQDVKPEKPDAPEQQFIDDFRKKHPEASVEDAIKAYASATQKPERNGAGDARADKSYQYNQSRLDKIRQPVDQLAQRFGRLQDTLNQHSPQADALIGPELLTIMAGGQGSGLRMNEAEIARIVGGRSAWENLKAKIQHWNTDPNDARTITPDQDRQIRALVDTVGRKITAKQAIAEAAQENLLTSDDPHEHRQIMADAQKKLDMIDAGHTENGGGGEVKPPKPPDPGMKWQHKTGPDGQVQWRQVKQ